MALVSHTMLLLLACLVALTTCSTLDSTVLDLVETTIQIGDTVYNGRKKIECPHGGPLWRIINGQPCIYIPKSDPVYRITLVNKLSEPTTLHPHGLTGAMDTDGVAFVTQTPIYPGRAERYEFRIPARDMGTYFLHGHYGFHHMDGLSVPLIIEGDIPDGYPDYDRIASATDAVMFLEDFCGHVLGETDGQNPYCNDSMSIYTTLKARWDSMAANFPMDTCQGPILDMDMAFRYHLVNERPLSDPSYVQCEPGDNIRLRIISSSSFIYYRLEFGSLNATVITADGKWVKPRNLADPSLDQDTPTNSIWLGAAQRYDVLINAPTTPGVYLIRAYVQVAFDSQHQQTGMLLIVGSNTPVPSKGTYSDLGTDNVYSYMWSDPALEAWFPLPSRAVDRELSFNITGDNGFRAINGYSWTRPPIAPLPYVPNPFPLLVKAGERVCINMNNFSPWAHPMHLHGHSFQVTSIKFGLGVNAPINGALRDTVQTTKGCGTTRICFDAANPGEWLLHCHKDLHAVAGMATSVEYTSGTPRSSSGVVFDPIDAAFPNWDKRATVALNPPLMSDAFLVVSRSDLATQQDQIDLAVQKSVQNESILIGAAFVIGVLFALLSVGALIGYFRREQESAWSRLDENSSVSSRERLELSLKTLFKRVMFMSVLMFVVLVIVIMILVKAMTAEIPVADMTPLTTWALFNSNAGDNIVHSACASPLLAQIILSMRPITAAVQLQTAVNNAVQSMSTPALVNAMYAVNTASLHWAKSPSPTSLATYQQRFGMPFLVRQGDADIIIALRLENSAVTEFTVAVNELSSIVYHAVLDALKAYAASPAAATNSSAISINPPPTILVTTHALDTSRGTPASGVQVKLERQLNNKSWLNVASAMTLENGRASFASADPPVSAGVYRIVFGIREYFQAFGQYTLYPDITVSFEVQDGQTHYHIPISASPFGYQTYRGS